MRILPFVVLALVLQAEAKADKFWLSDPAARQATEGSAPNVIEGVLIAESDEGYHVRIVGGEVLLPKQAVFRIEKDGLSVEAIVQQELAAARAQAAAPASAPAPAATRKALRPSRARAADAAAKKSAEPAAAAPAPVTPPAYDPVLHRAVQEPGTTSHAELMAEAQLAWTLTKDRRYMTLLRRLRRLH